MTAMTGEPYVAEYESAVEEGKEVAYMSDILARIEKRGREEGEKKGRKEGRNEITSLISALAAEGRNDDIIKAANDEGFLDKLLTEFNIKKNEKS